MKAYRIKNWDKYYENAQSRRYASLTWLPIPNRHDGKGYGRLACHKSAVPIMCAWILLLQVASKQPRRGLLADEDGPMTTKDLESITRFPQRIFDLAIEALAKPEIGWIEIIDCPTSITTSGKDPVSIHFCHDGMTEQREMDLSTPVTNARAPPQTEPKHSRSEREHSSYAHIEQNRTEQKRKEEKEKRDKKKARSFGDPKSIPPLPENVTAYAESIRWPLDGDGFCDSYAQKGWLIGKVRMKDWQAAVRTWKRNKWKPGEPLNHENHRSGNARGRHFRPTGRPIPSTAPGLL